MKEHIECQKYLIVFTRMRTKLVTSKVYSHGLFGKKEVRTRLVSKRGKETWVRRAASKEHLLSLVKSLHLKYTMRGRIAPSIKVYKFIDTVDSIDNLSMLAFQGHIERADKS